MKKIKILLPISLMIMLLSCDRGMDDELTSIDGTIQVLVAEAHAQVGPPSIVVHFETEELYPCSNSEILTEFSLDGEMISGEIQGIMEPMFCEQPGGPAISTHLTDIQNGDFLLEVTYDGNTDLYNITIEDESITIQAEQQSFTNNPFEVAWRFPENSFAFLCGTIDGSIHQCDDFADILNENSDYEEFSFTEEGFIPYPTSTSGFEYNAPATFYTYENQEDFQEIENILLDFDDEINASEAGVLIVIINWEFIQLVIGQQGLNSN